MEQQYALNTVFFHTYVVILLYLAVKVRVPLLWFVVYSLYGKNGVQNQKKQN